MRVSPGIAAHLQRLFPGSQIVAIEPLGHDAGVGERAKSLGYGRPVRIALDGPGGPRAIVVHALRADDFGHDRRADRIENLVLAGDTFGRIPHHVRAIDVGVLDREGVPISLAETGEPYLITPWIDGTIYADDLRRIATTGTATELDLARVDALTRVMLEIHAGPGTHPGAYTRAIRDLLGHGEGIFGLVDSYTADSVLLARLRGIEEACLAWRWRLRGHTDRLRRTHGDFHPFNVLFDRGTAVTLIDASRGGEGDPADDVACLAINFLFFGLGHHQNPRGLAALWQRFWDGYLAGATLDVRVAVAPFFAWRGLVLASPRWYPDLRREDRERILDFVDRALAADRFDPAWGRELL